MTEGQTHEIGIEEATRLLQHITANPPLMVIGSGCTAPHGLPTMSELASHLVTHVTSDSTQWEAFQTSLSNGNDLESALQAHALSPEEVDLVVRETWRCVTELDLAFHHKVLTGNQPFPLRDLLQHFGRTASPHLQAVTTNYDRLVEYAADLAGLETITGFTRGHIQRPVDRRSAAKAPARVKCISIHKVHGSLDWFRDEHDREVGVPLPQKIPEGLHPLIVTPGISKYQETHRLPYRHYLQSADEAIRDANNILLLGYGFNDDHLEPDLRDQVSKRSTAITVATHTLSENGRQLLLDTIRPRQYLILEAQGQRDTRLYSPKHPNGAVLVGHKLWSLDTIVDALQGTLESANDTF